MGGPSPRRRVLSTELARRYPHLEDGDALISAGGVLVNGFPRVNPESRVVAEDSITIRSSKVLRGTVKLAHALRLFAVRPRGRVALDLGAAAGRFTQALLDAGATRVYAVDVGFGQLRGSLRQDPRVINLEHTNLADLNGDSVPEPIGMISIDLSYLSIASAVPQLHTLIIEPEADLIALVKPTYELRLPKPPTDEVLLTAAVTHAAKGLSRAAGECARATRRRCAGTAARSNFLVQAQRITGKE